MRVSKKSINRYRRKKYYLRLIDKGITIPELSKILKVPEYKIRMALKFEFNFDRPKYRHASVAFLLSTGMTLEEVSDELDYDYRTVKKIAQIYNLRKLDYRRMRHIQDWK